MTELTWQRKIIASTRQQGGYGKKWSSSWAVGVPDLILSLPKMGPVFMEVKLERSNQPTFDRKLNVTKKQRDELRKLHRADAMAMIGVVVVCPSCRPVLVALPWSAERLEYPNRFLVQVEWDRGPGRKELSFDMWALIEWHLDQ